MYTAAAVLLLFLSSAYSATLPVGSGKSYPSPCAAIAAARPGDTIDVDPGVWLNDSCVIATSGLTIRSTGSTRARLEAAGGVSLAGGKAILVVDATGVTIEGFELHGAAAGAAILVTAGHGFSLRNCFLHDNHAGLVADGGGASEIHIESSEFARNGTGHNIDVGPAASLTLRYSYSHHSAHGHLVQSRAAENHILYNRLTQEAGPSLAPVAVTGRTLLIGNVVQRAPESVSGCMLEAGVIDLQATANTFVNDGPECALPAAAPSAILRNNIFQGPGWLPPDPDNLVGDAAFADAAAHDYRLRSESGAINAASPLPPALEPDFQYAHPLCGAPRVAVGVPDMGAFEYGSPEPPTCARAPIPAGADQSPEAQSSVVPHTLIALSSASSRPGAKTDVNLFLFNVASSSAAAQWRLDYPQGVFDSIELKAGPAAVAAGKNVYCTASDGRSMTCQLSGANSKTIPNGIAAIVTFRVSQSWPTGGSTPVSVTSGVSATVLGDVIPSRTMNGSVSPFRTAAVPLL